MLTAWLCPATMWIYVIYLYTALSSISSDVLKALVVILWRKWRKPVGPQGSSCPSPLHRARSLVHLIQPNLYWITAASGFQTRGLSQLYLELQDRIWKFPYAKHMLYQQAVQSPWRGSNSGTGRLVLLPAYPTPKVAWICFMAHVQHPEGGISNLSWPKYWYGLRC